MGLKFNPLEARFDISGSGGSSLPDQTGNNGKFLTTDGSNPSWGTPSVGGVAWGSVTGTLSDQTDLQTALDAKANSADLDDVATTGDYADLINTPSIPNVLDDLSDVNLTTPADDDILQKKAGSWVNRTIAQLKTDLSLTKSDVGLGNVDNTSDVNKPISTATQTALDGKVDENSPITGATKAKITYDSKGLVTAGSDLIASDIPSLTASKISDFDTEVSNNTDVAANTTARHSAVTVLDTDTIDFALTGQQVSGSVKQQMSISSDASGLKLSGDSSTPGNSKYYGTDGSGSKGFFSLPTGSGGQELYGAIVDAAGGGDYTTLYDAVTAGATSIFIRSGTYTESALTIATADLHIVGESARDVVLSYGANTLQLTANGVEIQNVGFSFTSGQLLASGENLNIHDNYFLTANNTDTALSFYSTNRSLITNNYFELGGTFDGRRAEFVEQVVVSDNMFNFTTMPSTSTNYAILINTKSTCSGNYFNYTGASSGGYMLTVSDTTVFTSNHLYGNNKTIGGIKLNYSCTACVFRGILGTAILIMGGVSKVNSCDIEDSTIGVDVNSNSYCAVQNCVITTTTGAGVDISTGDYTLVQSNVIQGATGVNISDAGANQTYIFGNNLKGCTTKISDSGTSTVISNNIGVGMFEETKSITIPDPTSSEDVSMFFTNKAITITKIVGVITGSTSVTATIRHHTDRNNAGNEVVTSGTVFNSTTTGNVVTSFNDATVPADSFVWVETTALSGTPTSLNLTIFFRQDA